MAQPQYICKLVKMTGIHKDNYSSHILKKKKR